MLPDQLWLNQHSELYLQALSSPLLDSYYLDHYHEAGISVTTGTASTPKERI